MRRELAASQAQAAQTQPAVHEKRASRDGAARAAKVLQTDEDSALAVEARAAALAREKAALQAKVEATQHALQERVAALVTSSTGSEAAVAKAKVRVAHAAGARGVRRGCDALGGRGRHPRYHCQALPRSI